ncbi:ABC transporter permease [Acaryochloris sp. CCMEE 5410]|uniref:ABC transporter permease n=1 Tax=Acaryochloris sp. CCMEE 5410 TaxID=310037 RepID=UPI0002483906|nr:ABC transporter permease [Acaryochloris sp. CCMEE 5410]KAI9134551.1 ABC transporter permease [Acaryochloris sp. CCMEE 5410]
MTSNGSAPPPQPHHQSGGLKPTTFWRIAEDIPANLKWALTAISIALPLGLWWGVSSTGVVNPDFLPSPIKVGQALVDLHSDGFLVKDTLMSCFRVGIGFFLAALISAPIGVAMGTFTSIRSLLEPIIGIVRYMPAPAFIPLLLIYLGIEELPKITLIFIGTVFFNILMIMDAVKFIPKELLETTYTLGGRRHQVLFQVITPYVIPNILDAFRVNMAASWNLVVVAELIAANEGLGKRIELAEKFFRTDDIFACLIVLGLIGFFIDLLFRWLLRFSCPWAID